jgi:hypothetical protein
MLIISAVLFCAYLAADRRGDMQQMMFFGCICRACKRFVRLGKIELEHNAPPSKLHAKLQETGWEQDEAICEYPECGHKTLASRGRTILGGPVHTSPNGVES